MAKAGGLLVSVVNWNNSAATNDCLASIARLAKADQPDVVVVDNHSTKEKLSIASEVRQTLRSLEVVLNKDNKGFAGGHNQNIREARQNGYDYIILLNNDSELIDKYLFKQLTAALEAEPQALGANPTIISSIDPDIIWYGGGRLSLVSSYAGHSKVGSVYSDSDDQVQKVTLLTGGCLAISLKRADLSALLLPQEYFLYWEDTEWSARARQAGFELLYVPKARLLHHVSSSLGARSPVYIYYNIRNHFLFVKRNISPVYRPLGWLRIGLIGTKYQLNILLRYRHERLKALRGLWWGLMDGTRGRSGRLQRDL